MTRGESCELTRNDCKIVITKWKDNKSVILMSSAFGKDPEDNCKRWSKVENKNILVSRPCVIRQYNMNMGGVDLADRYIAYYRTSLRTRKWTVRFFTHMLDLAVVNSWICYNRDAKAAKTPKKQLLGLLEFRAQIAEVLIKSSIAKPAKKRGSIDESTEIGPLPKKMQRSEALPSHEVRLDRVDHFSEFVKRDSPMKCRLKGCLGKTRFRCMKCNVYLCLQNRNCFFSFHNNISIG